MNNIKNLLEKCSTLGDAYHKKHNEITEIFNNYKKLSGKTKEENEKVKKINELINKTKDRIMSKEEFNRLKEEQRDIMHEFEKLENMRLNISYKKNKELKKQIQSKLYKKNETPYKSLNIIDKKINKLANRNYKYSENIEIIPNTKLESDKQTIIDFKPIIKVSPIQYLDAHKNKCVDKRKVTLIKKNKKVIKNIKKISKERKHKSLPKSNSIKRKRKSKSLPKLDSIKRKRKSKSLPKLNSIKRKRKSKSLPKLNSIKRISKKSISRKRIKRHKSTSRLIKKKTKNNKKIKKLKYDSCYKQRLKEMKNKNKNHEIIF